MALKGKFITFEGSEGSGKSTQIELIQNYLKKQKIPVEFIREPGGVKISEKIRDLLLDVRSVGMGINAETLLYMAARAQLVDEVIEPALKKGKIVLCDRFLDSTIAYQGYGSGLDVTFIKKIGQFVTQNIKPDLTLIFDIDAKVGLTRIKRAKDRIERRATAYHDRVRQGYLKIAKDESQRVKVIDSQQSKEEIYELVKGYVNKVLGLKG